jgi:hypothetical protein
VAPFGDRLGDPLVPQGVVEDLIAVAFAQDARQGVDGGEPIQLVTGDLEGDCVGERDARRLSGASLELWEVGYPRPGRDQKKWVAPQAEIPYSDASSFAS